MSLTMPRTSGSIRRAVTQFITLRSHPGDRGASGAVFSVDPLMTALPFPSCRHWFSLHSYSRLPDQGDALALDPNPSKNRVGEDEKRETGPSLPPFTGLAARRSPSLPILLPSLPAAPRRHRPPAGGRTHCLPFSPLPLR